MSSFSRRTFLAQSSLALAGLWGRPPLASRFPWMVCPAKSRKPVTTFAPDLVDPETLRRLARTAIEAAQRAGATYADIRVADTHLFGMAQGPLPLPFSWLQWAYAYGVRAYVDGVWAFSWGSDPTPAAVVRAAQSAVATAHGLSRVAALRTDMAPAPVVNGEWATPVQIDPFGVSPDEHAQLLGAFKETAERVPDGSLHRDACTWVRETRVFASSEGSLITQRFTRVWPQIEVTIGDPLVLKETVLPVPGLSATSAGLECLLGTAVHDHIKATSEEASRLARYPDGNADIGRFAGVLDGSAFGTILGSTLAPALSLDRALGHDADGAGVSFLAPVDTVLGQPLASPHVTITVDRTMPSYSAARWDDEGVPIAPFHLLDRGRVVDYLATRATAPALGAWYRASGRPLQSNGAAVSWDTTLMPTSAASQLRVEPGAEGANLEGLVKSMSNGLLVRGADIDYTGVSVNDQLTGAAIMPRMLYEVRQGQIIRRLRGGVVRFGTKRLLSGIMALGDTSTVQQYVQSDLRDDSTWTTVPISAPAAHVGQLDLGRMEGAH